MRKTILTLSLLFVASTTEISTDGFAQGKPLLTRQPTMSRTHIVFSYAGDLLQGQEKGKRPDPCALLTAYDVASITGDPMPVIDRSKGSCSYGILGIRLSQGREIVRRVSFGMKVYKDEQARDKVWAKIAQDANDPANKDDKQVLSGIGDEAYLVGRTKDGKLVDWTLLVHVRKGLACFSIWIIDKTGASSVDAAIAVARKIAEQL